MTEKVVSLSGGLVLGMVFALFLGIGATQNLSPSLHFEIPAILQMTIAQATHNTSAPANDTTPSINVTPPNGEDRGRITRIATLAETTDPAFAATQEEISPKNWNVAATPKINNSLQRVNLQRSYIASTSQTGTYISLGLVASQTNFTAIAGYSSGREGYGTGHQPSSVDGKPQSHGSPSTAQNVPDSGSGENEGGSHNDEPAVTGGFAKPGEGSDSDAFTNNHGIHNETQRPTRSFVSDHHGGGLSETSQRGLMFSQRNRRRPETD